MACSPGGLWDPDGIYWSRYDGWGKQLQQHRDANFAWKDGSVWLDGVSDVPPKLALESGASVGESLTCAQEETLIMLAFPTDREPAPAARCGGSQPPVENRVCPDGVGKPCRCPGVVEPGTLCGEMRPRQPLQAVQPFYKLNFTSPWVPLRELSRGPFARRCGSGTGGRTEVEGCHLDYKDKGSLLLSSKERRGTTNQKRAEDVSKDVSSFLNLDGGVLVYGVPETHDLSVTGGSPIPGGIDIGFAREEIKKETIENLITSNIQPRPGPDLFQVTEVPYGNDGRVVLIVEIGIGLGEVWQAKDKRYYRRFQFKAEPMEHYEIDMVRNRNVGPDLNLVFGINDRWETSMSNSEFLSQRGKEVQIHTGVQNAGDGVADSALIELGLWPDTNSEAMMRIYRGEFPDGIFPIPYTPIGIRNIKWEGARFQLPSDGLPTAWSQLFWNG